MIRLLIELPQAGAERVEVRGERLHYLLHVLRLGAGSSLEVFDGAGHRFSAAVESAGREVAVLRLGPAVEQAAPPPICIVQGLPKGERLEWILQKGTELGASAFAPFAAARSVARVDPARAEDRVRRWRRIAEEAARQSGRADVPEVRPPCSLADALGALAPGTRIAVLDEEEHERRLASALSELGRVPLAFVIGPEGGLTREEVALARDRGGIPVTLGPRVLRTETASLAALSIALHLWGELG